MSNLSDEAVAGYIAHALDLEDEANRIQEDKRQFFSSTREAHGKKFVTGLKLAIKIALMDADKRQEAEEIDAEAERILEIMRRGLHVARGAHTREGDDDQPGHDAETGEIIEPNSAAASNSDADAPVPSGAAKEVSPDASFAPIQPETAHEAPMEVDGDSVEVATAPLSESVDILPGGVQLGKDGRVDVSPAAPNPEAKATEAEPEEVQSASPDGVASRLSDGSGSVATNHPGGDHATSEGNALASQASIHEPDSPAFAEADTPDSPAPDFDYSSDVTPEAVEQMRRMAAPALAAMGELEVIDPPSLTGSAADKSAGGGGVSPAVPAAPTKLKMNAEFFGEPHPLCGGNSNLVLCERCRSAAGTDGHVHDAEERVLN